MGISSVFVVRGAHNMPPAPLSIVEPRTQTERPTYWPAQSGGQPEPESPPNARENYFVTTCYKDNDMSPGEKARRQRERERKAIAFNAITGPLMLAGHSCADCKHFAPMPFPDKQKHQCVMGQESGTYQVAYPNDICAQWSMK